MNKTLESVISSLDNTPSKFDVNNWVDNKIKEITPDVWPGSVPKILDENYIEPENDQNHLYDHHKAMSMFEKLGHDDDDHCKQSEAEDSCWVNKNKSTLNKIQLESLVLQILEKGKNFLKICVIKTYRYPNSR